MVPNGTPYGALEGMALAVRDGHISWLGPMRELPHQGAKRLVPLEGRWMTPGLIDCHTHLVYGGNRAAEFELRLTGASYEEIARAGGGIAATVAATRAADEETLLAAARPRLETLLSEGVTTVEAKSGYGLDLENEVKMLRVARRLAADYPVTLRTTFLGAHAVPPEYRDDRAGYLEAVITMLPAIAEAGLADAVDAFCESIAFTPEETARLFTAAQALGLPVKLHADQLSDLGGAALAARFKALSADHLEYTGEAGAAAMAAAGTVAVLLPGAFYVLRETQLPPIEAFRRHGVAMALATDCNPGSSPLTSPLLAMNLACTLFRMTPEEALTGFTRSAAVALGLGASHGTLEVGKAADLAVWEIERPGELAYRLGFNPLAYAIQDGKPRQSPLAV
ncbi:imidazolonepropionase [Phormidium willei BDU 130791]|nr:imidazolonepropionase [Phormidium willei BDU 130791]